MVDGTRVAVDEILDELAGGSSVSDVVARHPGLREEGVLAALAHAADTVRQGSRLADRAARELHGAHVVEAPGGDGAAAQPAVAVRAFRPEAVRVEVERLPAFPSGVSWLPAFEAKREDGDGPTGELPAAVPMERIHPDGVFEALFPGETEPFPYRLTITGHDGVPRSEADPYGLPPFLSPADLPQFGEPAATPEEILQHAEQARRQDLKLGAHPAEHVGLAGVSFAVWAPAAAAVSVIGDFNGWNSLVHPLRPVGDSGVWELFIPGLSAGARYKYRITGPDGSSRDKADPHAYAAELRPGTASIVWDLGRYRWEDDAWLAERRRRQDPGAPLSIYEVHLGSWRRAPAPEGGPRWLGYRELADELVAYAKQMGYTHIEPMPVAEHPFDGSWGYQVTGFFAPTARYGDPDDFRYFVDRAHQAGLGVILDWVPGHFPKDEHGLARFDGTPLYEHPDPRRSENLEWGTSAFNLDRPEIAAFLLSNALFWIEEYHIDGLRVDAVSSMIYLDYSRQHWVPNALGGRENLEAAAFLQRLNEVVHRDHPGVLTIAEESTAWPHVTGRDNPESLGFDLKWNLGWMHDTLRYAERDPIHRQYHHHELTFSLVYAFSERFVLPYSHDEVVHGKRPMLAKMPGDEPQRFANLRAIYGYMFGHPGKKLQFMGDEFGAVTEWSPDAELDWSLLDRARHRGLSEYVRALNRLYRAEPALHAADFGWEGFEWVDCDDAGRSILAFVRRAGPEGRFVVCAVNFTPVPRPGYRLGVPAGGSYVERLNSDAREFGGEGGVNPGAREAEAIPGGRLARSIAIDLPPLAFVCFGPEERVGAPDLQAQARH